jgi:hypothetical protein
VPFRRQAAASPVETKTFRLKLQVIGLLPVLEQLRYHVSAWHPPTQVIDSMIFSST